MTDTTVDPNTDDLDAFNDLMLGRAKPAEAPSEEATEEKVEDTPETEDDSPGEVETPAPEDDEDTPKPEEKPKKNRFQDRIDELTRQRHEADREKAELRRQLDEALKQKTEDKPTEKAAESPNPDDKLEDGSEKYPLGEFDPSYIRDLTRFTIGEEKKTFEAEAKRQSEERIAQEASQRQLDEWKGKLDNAIETKYPDFLEKNVELEETLRDLDEGYSAYLASTIMQMDHGTDVLYYLASNPSEAKRIAGLGATKATIALGRIEATFDREETERKQLKVSKAAPPPETVKGTSVTTTIRPDTDDLDAFEKEFFKRKR
jgi:hypothetical protein